MFTRLESVVSVAQMLESEVTLVGAGASFTLAANLARCGLGRINLVDPQTVELANVSRQDHLADTVGMLKVEAVRRHLLRINPQMQVRTFPLDFCTLSDDEINDSFGATDLFIAATDHFPAQAQVSEVALRLGTPTVFIGLYPGAGAGEIAYWDSDIDSCYRCLCSKRYAAHQRAQMEGRSVDPSSDGADIFAIQFLDAIAGQLSIGLLTRGSPNRFGRLIDQLGSGPQARNFLQVRIDPGYTFAGRDIFRDALHIPETCDAYFAWATIVRSDNAAFQSGCRDCALYRGHYWEALDRVTVVRRKPGDPEYREAEAARQRARYLADPAGFLFV